MLTMTTTYVVQVRDGRGTWIDDRAQRDASTVESARAYYVATAIPDRPRRIIKRSVIEEPVQPVKP